MKKTLLILSLILVSVISFAQRQRTTAMFDSDTTTRPKAGFYGIGVRANNIYFVPPTGNNVRLANYSLFTGLGTNYLPKWNGSKLVNSSVFESVGNVGIGTTSPSEKLEVANAGGVSIRLFNTLANSWDIKNTSGAGDLAFTRGGVNTHLFISANGYVGLGTITPVSKLQVVGLPTYADNAAAISGGLTAGAFYRTSTGVLMVVY